ncbi:MAG: hypothetical protein ACOZIN_01610 [Myxococcota bacterium]
MRLRGLIGLLLFSLGTAGVVAPLLYFYTSSQLPPMESELDIERLLRLDIESERMRLKLSQYDRDAVTVTFERPDFSRLPKDLVGLYLSQRRCPAYFQTAREEGAAWAWRMLVGLVSLEPGGEGGCERLFALRLAKRLGARGALQLSVGAHRIHSLLEKDQLIAYDLFSMWFEPGWVGVDHLAHKLFKKRLERLRLSELAELMLALPPHNYYRQMRDCQNPTLLRQNRDSLLKDLSRDALVSEEQVRSAMAHPVACTMR